MTELEQINHGVRIQYLEVLSKYNLTVNEAIQIADGYLSSGVVRSQAQPQPLPKAPEMTNPNPVQESNRTQQETNQAVKENEQIAEEIQNQPNVPPRYEDMIKMTNIHEAAAPRDSGIKISRPLNDVRDSRGISETGGEIKNR